MGINIHEIKDIRKYLAKELKGLNPEKEINAIASIIIMTLPGIKRLHQFYDSDQPVSPEFALKVMGICNELKMGKPIQYILGETIFYDCVIKVNHETLIPRQETEEMIDLIIKENKGFNGTIVDVGTGSGCIAIALSKNLPDAKVTGIDISEGALKLAGKNALLNNVNVRFIKADIFNFNLTTVSDVGILVSNPPYVRDSEKQYMNRNVLGFEPHHALFVPDSDPLIFYRAILKLPKNILNSVAKIYFEINEAMGSKMFELLATFNYSEIRIFKDINGKDRIIKGER
jgi:release factor glutamine methyltransferase